MAWADNIFVWIYATFGLVVLLLVYTILLFFLIKKTHAIKELKALYTGKPLCLFFTDHKTVEWLALKPSSGVIQSEKYGSFLVNENGTYVDRQTKNVIIPFSAEIGSGAAVTAFADADAISKILKDNKMMGQVREALSRGELNDARFDHLKESVNFSQLKGLMNTMLPHNITALINMSIAQRFNSLNMGGGKQFIWYACLGISIVVLAGVVVYVVMGKGSNPQITINAADLVKQTIQNASVIAG